MNDVHEQAKERLATYRSEADIRRQLPELWRVQLARTLRAVAARLERPLPTKHDEWHTRRLKQID